MIKYAQQTYLEGKTMSNRVKCIIDEKEYEKILQNDGLRLLSEEESKSFENVRKASDKRILNGREVYDTTLIDQHRARCPVCKQSGIKKEILTKNFLDIAPDSEGKPRVVVMEYYFRRYRCDRPLAEPKHSRTFNAAIGFADDTNSSYDKEGQQDLHTGVENRTGKNRNKEHWTYRLEEYIGENVKLPAVSRNMLSVATGLSYSTVDAITDKYFIKKSILAEKKLRTDYYDTSVYLTIYNFGKEKVYSLYDIRNKFMSFATIDRGRMLNVLKKVYSGKSKETSVFVYPDKDLHQICQDAGYETSSLKIWLFDLKNNLIDKIEEYLKAHNANKRAINNLIYNMRLADDWNNNMGPLYDLIDMRLDEDWDNYKGPLIPSAKALLQQNENLRIAFEEITKNLSAMWGTAENFLRAISAIKALYDEDMPEGHSFDLGDIITKPDDLESKGEWYTGESGWLSIFEIVYRRFLDAKELWKENDPKVFILRTFLKNGPDPDSEEPYEVPLELLIEPYLTPADNSSQT